MVQTAIIMEGLRFHGRHGVHPEERLSGQWFRVDLRVELPPGRHGADDRLGATLDYEKLYALCAGVMARRADLLETLAEQILLGVGALLPDCGTITVRVAKEAPPFAGPCERVAIELSGRPDTFPPGPEKL